MSIYRKWNTRERRFGRFVRTRRDSEGVTVLGNECAAEREKRKNRIDGIETRWYGQDGGDGTRRHAVDGPRVVEPVFGKKNKKLIQNSFGK